MAITPVVPQFSRRRFIGGAVAAMSAVAFSRMEGAGLTSGDQAKPAFPPKSHVNPYVYQFSIGEIEAWSISDGHMLFKEGVGLMRPTEQREVMAAHLREHGERTDGLPLYINVLVLRQGREIVLFDAGFGSRSNPHIGWLADGLASIGITNDQVTQAILSHGHADHIGGFVSDGKPMYPNAALRVLQAEVDFWRASKPDFTKSHRRDNIPKMIEEVRGAFDILQPNLQTHRDGDQILNGAITFEAAPGHTDGHCVLRVQSGNESLVHFMDVAHHHLLMFTNPSWFIEFDHQPDVAVTTRKKVFGRLSGTGERAYGFHLPWPGLGRVHGNHGAFRWESERWKWGS
jgi:glyoxylase-like metal-dependent hydrolase (beta-lactamase superfamily II)